MDNKFRVLVLRLAVLGGFASLGYYLYWWFEGDKLRSPWLILWLIAAVLYAGVQMAGNWLLYLVARVPQVPPLPTNNLSIDVFVTAYKEPPEIVKLSLQAACAMRLTHKTWLLDDGADPSLAILASSLGAGYFNSS